MKVAPPKLKMSLGPWSTKCEQLRFDNSRIVYGADGLHVAYAADFNRFDRDAEADANAVLISLSPEMVEVMELFTRLDKQFEHTPGDFFLFRVNLTDMMQIAQAIAKLGLVTEGSTEAGQIEPWLPYLLPDRTE